MCVLALSVADDPDGPSSFALWSEPQPNSLFLRHWFTISRTARSVVKFTVFMRDVKDVAAYRRARDRFMGESPRPASTLVEVSKLVSEDLLIEIEAVAAA